jgi:hypothetical protein
MRLILRQLARGVKFGSGGGSARWRQARRIGRVSILSAERLNLDL